MSCRKELERLFDIKRLFPRIKDVLLVKDYLEYSWTLLEKSSGVALSGLSSLAELGVFSMTNFIKTSSAQREEGMETEEDGYLSTVPEEEEQQQTPAVPSQRPKRRLVEAARPPNPDYFAAPPPPSSGGFIGFGLPPPSSRDGNDSPSEAAQEEDKENEEPPKNEVVPVIEDDSVYSIKCKVFRMTDNQYKDKRKGNLYIKMLSEGKFQLVSAKDVMTFDVMGNKGKGMPILLRVKDEDAATELISQLKEFQRQSA
ncbi:Nuclear pore complex protein Nup50 [Orchesella cincta]|uniref:Nuclear pore complex protein Nup50 n=1 Tax=Orchesella cincta TaxID=48709 RepID=A0A1D2M4L1_ORCCI|nr:Nuclear pore complex protein Nup50 [Orchesella cincta]